MAPPITFAELYRQHADAVFRLAWILTGDRSDAEDLTSEAFARALAGEGRIVQDTVRSYLYAIVRNLATSRLRRPVVEVPAGEEVLDTAADLDAGPEARAGMRQRLVQASAALAALREPERQVLLLCGVHGLGNAEIADALGLTVGNVRVRLHRARQQLNKLVGDTYDGTA